MLKAHYHEPNCLQTEKIMNQRISSHSETSTKIKLWENPEFPSHERNFFFTISLWPYNSLRLLKTHSFWLSKLKAVLVAQPSLRPQCHVLARQGCDRLRMLTKHMYIGMAIMYTEKQNYIIRWLQLWLMDQHFLERSAVVKVRTWTRALLRNELRKGWDDLFAFKPLLIFLRPPV